MESAAGLSLNSSETRLVVVLHIDGIGFCLAAIRSLKKLILNSLIIAIVFCSLASKIFFSSFCVWSTNWAFSKQKESSVGGCG